MFDIIDSRETRLADRQHTVARLGSGGLTSAVGLPIISVRHSRGAVAGLTQYATESFGTRMTPPGTPII